MNDKTRKMTLEEWLAEGRRRFGPDSMNWKFVCPMCGHIQSVTDFKQYQDRGATPDSARHECIGRYMDECKDAFSEDGKGPCNYAGYGLFKFSPIIVVADGNECLCFDFAD